MDKNLRKIHKSIKKKYIKVLIEVILGWWDYEQCFSFTFYIF